MRNKDYRCILLLIVTASMGFLAGCEGYSIKSAIPLKLGAKVEGVLRKGAPTYYKFDGKVETLYQILVRESVLIRLTLMTEDGETLEYQHDVEKMFWPGISFLVDGTYILRVEAAKDVAVEYPAYGDDEILRYELMVRQTPDIQNTEESDFLPLIREAAPVNDNLDFFNQPKYYRIDVPARITGEGAVNRYHVRLDTLKYTPRVVVNVYDQKRQRLATYINRVIVDAEEEGRPYYLSLTLNYDDVPHDDSMEFAQTNYAIRYEKIPRLGVSPEVIVMPAASDYAQIVVDSTTGSPIGQYSSSSTASWISITSGATGIDRGTIAILCDPNTNAIGRTGYVWVTSQYGGSLSVLVRQSGAS